MSHQPLSTRVGVWIDGDVMLKVGEYNAKSITLLTRVGRHQLLHEGRHSVYLPTKISLHVAKNIMQWVDQALPPTADNWTTPIMPSQFFLQRRPSHQLSLILNFYMALQYIGTRTDVLFDVASRFYETFRNTWRTMDQLTIELLCSCVRRARWMFDGDARDLLHDPVVRLVAHTVAYGIQHAVFPDLQMVVRALTTRPGLNEFLARVGVVRYPIRGFIPLPAIYPLLARRRLAIVELQGVYSIVARDGPAGENDGSASGGTEPIPRHLDMRSTISVDDMLHVDGWVMVVGVDEGQEGEDGDREGGNKEEGNEDEEMDEGPTGEGGALMDVDLGDLIQSLGAMSF
ncbi:hypothetical protein P171DRAFT_203837 [Karstenula rhodostoma CBS 690.94]|uniref:Uncharacterized protein n=1 Tax=Karstenula rhodostoma CBS 690.94 TaxID=1392251 RepID=A0A9P4PWD1_9PLEO|nr:hypothetical protein P171DRAFT_203837 [Karstenula rhodostoma CBS 690.94]